MELMSVTEVKENLCEILIRKIRTGGKVGITLFKDDKTAAVLLSAGEYDRLMAVQRLAESSPELLLKDSASEDSW